MATGPSGKRKPVATSVKACTVVLILLRAFRPNWPGSGTRDSLSCYRCRGLLTWDYAGMEMSNACPVFDRMDDGTSNGNASPVTGTRSHCTCVCRLQLSYHGLDDAGRGTRRQDSPHIDRSQSDIQLL